jgi:hypothetical protein
MLVTADALRERFESLPTGELRRIVASRPGEYTSEALAAASAVLANRRPHVPEEIGSEEHQPERRSVTLAILGAIALSSTHIAQIAVRAWQEVEPRSHAFARIGYDLLVSPLTYVLVAVGAVWLWRQRADK